MWYKTNNGHFPTHDKNSSDPERQNCGYRVMGYNYLSHFQGCPGWLPCNHRTYIYTSRHLKFLREWYRIHGKVHFSVTSLRLIALSVTSDEFHRSTQRPTSVWDFLKHTVIRGNVFVVARKHSQGTNGSCISTMDPVIYASNEISSVLGLILATI